MPRHTHTSQSPPHDLLNSEDATNRRETVVPLTRKALLIGVRETLQPQAEKLTGTHKDVRAMKNLLIATYQYQERDIITLLDCRDTHPKDRHPTRENILRELHALVEDAQPRDHLFFYYAGHVEQQTTDDPKEEDGLDEFIVPCDCDGVENAIQDDVLREILVETLPAQCKLTAVFDACHSGTLLDLDHWRCNRRRAKVPFLPQFHLKEKHTLRNNNGKQTSQQGLTVYENLRTNDTQFTQSKTTLPISLRRTVNVENNQAFPSRTPTATSAKVWRILRKTRTTLSITAVSNSLNFFRRRNTSPYNISNSVMQKQIQPATTTQKHSVPLRKPTRLGSIDIPIPRCASPIQFCDGDCHDRDEYIYDGPLVIALSACTDAQRAWESGDQGTLTKTLVDLLQKNPHPRLATMMDNLGSILPPPSFASSSQTNHEISRRIHHAIVNTYHKETLKYKKQLAKWKQKHPSQASDRPLDEGQLNLDETQDPQLSSLRPLEMSAEWAP
ncbi:caspase domain-containing protein [Lentinula aff. lateritia]|uniref:Caspase domain-containing protein n=1 Tax=Lentinula aff. lateritia TaxID=2804960 RepID=A0ACC1U3N1_9AGAR|nr:caspase domain-containing protein [Lentinula aff. lateritia]